jgi:outer membrane receptor protein involved in Fe transport
MAIFHTGDYGSIATLGSFGYPFGTTLAAGIGQAPNVLGNPDLQWEKSKTYDIGLDFGILKTVLLVLSIIIIN